MSRNPDRMPAYGSLAATYAEVGHPDQSCAQMLEALRLSPAVLAGSFAGHLPYEDRAMLACVDAYNSAGLAPSPL